MHSSDVTAAPVKLQAVSLVEKPDPVTDTVAPTCADVGSNVSEMEVDDTTLNVADAESSSGVPLAVMEYELAATLATTNDALRIPPEIEHDVELTTPPDR